MNLTDDPEVLWQRAEAIAAQGAADRVPISTALRVVAAAIRGGVAQSDLFEVVDAARVGTVLRDWFAAPLIDILDFHDEVGADALAELIDRAAEMIQAVGP